MAQRPNTAAREYLNPSEQSLLEKYGVTSAEFDRVRGDDHAPEMAAGNEPLGGSEMVKQDQPRLEPKPPKEMAQEVDREAFERKWAEELTRAQDNAPEQDNTREPDREYDR